MNETHAQIVEEIICKSLVAENCEVDTSSINVESLEWYGRGEPDIKLDTTMVCIESIDDIDVTRVVAYEESELEFLITNALESAASEAESAVIAPYNDKEIVEQIIIKALNGRIVLEVKDGRLQHLPAARLANEVTVELNTTGTADTTTQE
jgi:hypothetical protein